MDNLVATISEIANTKVGYDIAFPNLGIFITNLRNTITIGAANKNPDINNREDIVGTIDIEYDDPNARTIEGYSLQYYLDNYDYKQKIKKITYYG